MDMEWGIDERDGKIWILQARPETVWSRRNKEKKNEEEQTAGSMEGAKVLLKGLPASPGQAMAKPMSSATRRILTNSRMEKSSLRK